YILRQCRLRGKIDSNGCTTAFLEERLNMGLNFILSAEIDHKNERLQIWIWIDRRMRFDFIFPRKKAIEDVSR
ncbi:hypothetical protein SQ11_15355, partial [Nitrosospira sp. NpAV]